MDDPATLKQEIDYLTAEAERLRRERDSYREQNEARQAKAEETISTQLRLLSADLSNKVQTDFFSLLKWVGGIVVIALTVATAGGFFTFSTLINTTVDREVREQVRDKVKEKDEDIKSLRTSIIQGAVDFRREADKSVAEIRANADKILAEIRASAGQVKEARESALREIAPRPANPPPSIETAAVTPPPPEIFNIQVVVQVVYRTPEENISDEQIKSQIVVLNEDYRAKNADISKVPEPFKPFIGDARIQFSLATIDPAGRPTTGITRTRTNKPAFSDDDGVKSRSKGGADAWDTERYLNIWVATLAGGLLNYSQFPGGPKDTDGVVSTSTTFGTVGTVKAPFNKGRGATHAIGHYLGLRHTWGDANDCSGSDLVADTPVQQGPNFGKPTFPHITCNNGPNGDMFMNFLDYVDDEAMYMFTKGQVQRMHQTLRNERPKLIQ
ncbi:MAG TPA: M43 family zinc metalloprotease [Mesorhizobium sp.]|nr:M43 family zinc metalloprotease [Mesorhizobium sp.]